MKTQPQASIGEYLFDGVARLTVQRTLKMAEDRASDQMARQLREAWFRYLDTIAPIRPSLYRYCRRITRDVWDAEDLLQETLLKGFGAIGRGDLSGGAGGPVKDSRGYLFRIATNLWIDQIRRSQIPWAADAAESSTQPEQAASAREAVSVLVAKVGPQERAAVMLKDVFDFSLEEIAEMLSTTIGAIKSALHRGRASLEETRDTRRPSFRAPSKQLIDRLVEAFNARDVNLVTALLVDNVTLDVPGVGGERGKNMIWLRTSSEESRAEAVMYNGEWIVVQWGGPRSAPILVTAERFEEEDGYVTRIREYFYCPETLAEIATELGSHSRPHGYHQAPDVLSRMIGDAVLPWAATPGLPQ